MSGYCHIISEWNNISVRSICLPSCFVCLVMCYSTESLITCFKFQVLSHFINCLCEMSPYWSCLIQPLILQSTGCKCYFWSAVPSGAWFISNRPLQFPCHHYTGMDWFICIKYILKLSFPVTEITFFFSLEQGLDDLINIFRRPPSRKVKGA